jgi:hypothetical protein
MRCRSRRSGRVVLHPARSLSAREDAQMMREFSTRRHEYARLGFEASCVTPRFTNDSPAIIRTSLRILGDRPRMHQGSCPNPVGIAHALPSIAYDSTWHHARPFVDCTRSSPPSRDISPRSFATFAHSGAMIMVVGRDSARIAREFRSIGTDLRNLARKCDLVRPRSWLIRARVCEGRAESSLIRARLWLIRERSS